MKNKKTTIYLRIFLIFCLIIFPFFAIQSNGLKPNIILNYEEKLNKNFSNKSNNVNNNLQKIENEDFLKEELIAENNQNDLTSSEEAFFKIYKQENKLLTSNLQDMGKVTALKISGLPLVRNASQSFQLYDLFLNELTIKDINNENVEYRIDYLRAINVNLPSIQPTFEEDDVQNIFDNDLETKLIVKNASAQQTIELNILLSQPTILSNVLMAINLTKTDNWAQIGSFEFLTNDGAVYRQDNLMLDDYKTGSNVDGSNYNISLLSSPSSEWTIFKPSIETNDQDLFMWSYKKENLAVPNSIAYFGDLMPNRSITPILVSSTKAFIEETLNHTIIDEKHFYGKPSRQQKLEFLKTIDDSSFWDVLLRTINLNHEDKNNLTISVFDEFDQSFKNDNNKKWNLKVIFKGDGTTLDKNTLQNLEFLGTLQEINKLEFSSSILASESFSYILNLDQMDWIKNMNSLEELSFQGPQGPNTILANNSLFVYGNPQNWDYLNASSLYTLDLTAFRSFINIESSYLNDQLINNSWIASIPKGFTFYVPNTVISGHIGEAIENIFEFEEVKKVGEKNEILVYDYLKLTKKIAAPYKEPTFYLDENNNYQTTTINVNGNEIFAKLIGGILYWDFSNYPNIKPSNIIWSDHSQQFYFTADDPHYGFDESELIRLAAKKDYEDLPISNVSIEDPGQLNNNNYGLIDDYILIDEKPYYAKINEGNIFWDYDITQIKYGYRPKNSMKNRYFTSLNSLISLIGEENLIDFYVFELENNTNDEYRKMYYEKDESELIVKDVDVNQSTNQISIDENIYNDWIIKLANIVWNLNGEVNIEDIKFIDDKGNYFTSVLNKDGHVISNLTSVIIHEPYNVIPTKNPPLNDPGIIQSPDDIKKTIFIDEEEIKVTLRNGFLYWDYPIENIQYEAFDPIRQVFVYYTLFSKIAHNIPLQNVSSIEQAQLRNIPSNASFPILDNKPGVIEIISGSEENPDNIKEYSSFFAYGKWYWNIPKDILIKVRYKDNNNIFYTELNSENFARSGMTEVFLPDIESLITELDEFETEFPINLNSQNINQISAGYTIDGEQRNFMVFDNKVYFDARDWELANYIYVRGNDQFELYSSFEGLEIQKINFLFSKSLFTQAEPTLKKAEISAPNSIDDVIKIIDQDGNVNIVEVINSNGKFYYNDIEELLQINYVNNDGIYFSSLKKEYINSVFTSVDVFASHLEQIANRKSDIYQKQLEDKNLISKILVISAGASIGIIFTIILIIRFAARNKKR